MLVKDVAETSVVFEENGVESAQLAEGIHKVNPVEACGAHLYFQQA